MLGFKNFLMEEDGVGVVEMVLIDHTSAGKEKV